MSDEETILASDDDVTEAAPIDEASQDEASQGVTGFDPEAEALARRHASPNFVPLGADDLVRILHELPEGYAVAYATPEGKQPSLTIVVIGDTARYATLFAASDWDLIKPSLSQR